MFCNEWNALFSSTKFITNRWAKAIPTTTKFITNRWAKVETKQDHVDNMTQQRRGQEAIPPCRQGVKASTTTQKIG